MKSLLVLRFLRFLRFYDFLAREINQFESRLERNNFEIY